MSTTVTARSATAPTSQTGSALAASRKFKTFATTFSITGPVMYCLSVYFNLPVFTYFPAIGRFAWGVEAVQSGTGPNMLWYGWVLTTIFVAGALGLIAMALPERVTSKIPLFLVWLVPILSIPYVVYSLMFWWRLAMRQ
jgi:hypothetical protein